MKHGGFILLDTLISLSIATVVMISAGACLAMCTRTMAKIIAADCVLATGLATLDQVQSATSGNPTVVSVSVMDRQLQRVVLR